VSGRSTTFRAYSNPLASSGAGRGQCPGHGIVGQP
jgi:hypothetical protein